MVNLRFFVENDIQTIENRDGVLAFSYEWDMFNSILKKYFMVELFCVRKFCIKKRRKKGNMFYYVPRSKFLRNVNGFFDIFFDNFLLGSKVLTPYLNLVFMAFELGHTEKIKRNNFFFF